MQRSATTPISDSSNTMTTRNGSSIPSLPQRSATTTDNAQKPSKDKTLPKRPPLPTRQTSVQTRYMTMLLSLDTIPRLHNILASFFTWLLLAGFLVFPGTFTSLSTSISSDPLSANPSVKEIINSVKNIPLLAIAGACCGIGASGMCWLWWKWQGNYVWLLNRIFLPGVLNSLAGLISTLINVYTQQDSRWSVTARVTAIVTGSCMVVTAILFAMYNFWALQRVKKSHARDMAQLNRGDENDDMGLLEKIGRKAKEPALEPGSVV